MEIQADGTPVSAGGFDPVVEVFDAQGSRVDDNDDGTDVEVATDPLTDSALDVSLASTLTAGTYTVVIIQYDNHAIGPTLAESVARRGMPAFTSAFHCSNGRFCDQAGYDRTSFWAFDILGAEMATTVAPDRDLDGIPDAVDNCPTVANPGQEDGGGGEGPDGVGDACDNCVNVDNPIVPGGAAAFLAANPWATLTGGQRDDDHDGYGNKCDGDFNDSSAPPRPTRRSTRRRSASPRSTDTCGTAGNRPCAIFDLNSANSTETSAGGISAADTARYKLLLGAPRVRAARPARGPARSRCPASRALREAASRSAMHWTPRTRSGAGSGVRSRSATGAERPRARQGGPDNTG